MQKDVNTIKLLDVVALLKVIPEKELVKGEVGTVVEQFDDAYFEVEFSNKKGRFYNSITLNAKDLIVLHFRDSIAV